MHKTKILKFPRLFLDHFSLTIRRAGEYRWYPFTLACDRNSYYVRLFLSFFTPFLVTFIRGDLFAAGTFATIA